MVDNRYSLYKGLSNRCVESLMPKGVEHGGNCAGSPMTKCVESLMPKGVEHEALDPQYNPTLMVLNL